MRAQFTVGRCWASVPAGTTVPASLPPSLPAQHTLSGSRHPTWALFVSQDIVSALEDRLRPLVQAELSVLVDVLHRPELLFPENTDARRKCESGGFICK